MYTFIYSYYLSFIEASSKTFEANKHFIIINIYNLIFQVIFLKLLPKTTFTM